MVLGGAITEVVGATSEIVLPFSKSLPLLLKTARIAVEVEIQVGIIDF